MFLLQSPRRGGSNEYTTVYRFQYKIEYHLKLTQICSYRTFSKGLKNEFETARVNEPSVFELLYQYGVQVVQVMQMIY